MAAAALLAPAPAARGEGALFDCPHGDCDCPAPFTVAELDALLVRLGNGDEAAPDEVLARGKRFVEAVHARYLRLPPRRREVALAAALPLRGLARPLVAPGLADPHPIVRQAAIRLAVVARDGLALSGLAESPLDEERLVAARALGGAEAAEPALLRLLEDASEPVRVAAARSLRLHRADAVTAALVRAIATDPSAEVREQARIALTALAPVPNGPRTREEVTRAVAAGARPPELLPVLPDLLRGLDVDAYAALQRDADPRVRLAALAALGASMPDHPFERDRAEALLVEASADPEVAVARAAVRALGRGRVLPAAPALVERLRRRGDPLAPDVLAALTAISGQRRKPTYAAWRAWLDEVDEGDEEP